MSTQQTPDSTSSETSASHDVAFEASASLLREVVTRLSEMIYWQDAEASLDSLGDRIADAADSGRQYTAAQHCLNVSLSVPDEDAFSALMLSAARCLALDGQSSLAHQCVEHAKAVSGVTLQNGAPETVLKAIEAVLATEERDFHATPTSLARPLSMRLVAMTSPKAACAMMSRYNLLRTQWAEHQPLANMAQAQSEREAQRMH